MGAVADQYAAPEEVSVQPLCDSARTCSRLTPDADGEVLNNLHAQFCRFITSSSAFSRLKSNRAAGE
jgi:hypothetical protein